MEHVAVSRDGRDPTAILSSAQMHAVGTAHVTPACANAAQDGQDSIAVSSLAPTTAQIMDNATLRPMSALALIGSRERTVALSNALEIAMEEEFATTAFAIVTTGLPREIARSTLAHLIALVMESVMRTTATAHVTNGSPESGAKIAFASMTVMGKVTATTALAFATADGGELIARSRCA